MKNIFWIFGLLMLLTSCGGDDDICLNSDSTPRLKLKFRNSNDQLIRMDTLYIDVDFGKDSLRNTTTAVAVDSVLVPLRIDDSSFTDFYVRTRKA